MPFLEVTIPFNHHLHCRREYRGKIPDGHSNPIYLVLKALKLQNVWRIFDCPVSSMYCKYAEYACKLQKNLTMTNKTYNMQNNEASYCKYKYAEFARICPKIMNVHDQQKKDQ